MVTGYEETGKEYWWVEHAGNCKCRDMNASYLSCAVVNYHNHERCVPEGVNRILISERTGDFEWGPSADGPWTTGRVGDVLTTCKYLRLPQGSTSIKWVREGACLNTGKVEKSDPSQVRLLHVGKTGLTPVDRRGETPRQEEFVFAAVDLVLAEGVDASEATIIEGPGCTGIDHCGISSPIAEAAPIAVTPGGYQTTFSGRLVAGPEGSEVTFRVDASSPIPVATTALVGPDQGQLNLVYPGRCITYFANGTFDTRACAAVLYVPTVSKWGLLLVALGLLAAGMITLRQWRSVAAAAKRGRREGSPAHRPTMSASALMCYVSTRRATEARLYGPEVGGIGARGSGEKELAGGFRGRGRRRQPPPALPRSGPNGSGIAAPCWPGRASWRSGRGTRTPGRCAG